ncbi:glyoxalase [Streptomyces sp. TRM66268-LWL]|uniref:Glyoxalase n=1 Tax=Streptomyces polyasparticus TaxID=2767826 RepID=A0ABR7SAG7_9ACTN|nr:glyoxalase [Streptomyces polyasparticus]MBC9712471.1 glyoxalase [Streptomyces polyasparticus]
MTNIEYLTIEAADPAAAQRFYADAFGLDGKQLRVQGSEAPTSGFRGFTVSLVVSQPSIVIGLFNDAIAAGAKELKPAKKSLWGFGGVVQAPDGTVWQLVSSSKKDTGPDVRKIDEVVLLLGVADMAASKQFYVERGLKVGKSFGGRYTEFEAADSPVKLSLYPRKGLGKVAGVATEGSGSHRLLIGSDLGAFTDPDGFEWESAA